MLHSFQFFVVEQALQHNHPLPPLWKAIYYESSLGEFKVINHGPISSMG